MSRRLPFLLAALLVMWGQTAHGQSAYDVALPVELTSSPDLCTYAPCRDVMPGAERFSLRKGRPAYVEAFGPGEADAAPLLGYVFLSTDIVDIPAYSGKPVVTLIGMDTAGTIVGTRILKHSEPILLVGIPEAQLTRFVNQFIGKRAWDKVEIGRARDAAAIGVDGISGATVTVIAQNQVMMRSAYQVARQVGIVQTEPRAPAVFVDDGARQDWAGLVREGSVQRLRVTAADVGETSRDPIIDIHFGYLNAPAVGRSVLGDAAWTRLMERLGPDEHAIFLIASGRESFKGSGFVRGGIYDRVQVAQDVDTYTFRDRDYLNLYGIEAPGAPAFSESAIFIVRGASFSGAYPWSLVFLANTVDRATGQRTFTSFDQEYWLAAKYLEGGRPQVATPEAAWVTIWRNRAPEIAIFVTLLVGIAVAQTVRDRLTRASSRQNHWPVESIKYVGWAVSIGFVGFHLMAQPSITQVLTWFHGVVFDWNWELFLSEPFVFIFWVFILITVFIWGRGLFCGWLCPFGSLSEMLHKIGGVIGLGRFQFKLPMKWHDRLKWVKYAVFLGLLVVSFFSMTLAETLAEVEPFKTTFLVGIWNRSWPFALFATGLLGLSLFIERPFCKYLCPLGASLAMPSTFRWIGLRRKPACNSCAACAVRCGSQAIDADGRIDHRECLLCLECMILYTDAHTCPPLVVERKRREKAGLPLTPIGADGHYIPLTAVASGPAAVWPVKPKSNVDPRMQTDPVEPAWERQPSIVRRAMAELRHHFWPIGEGRRWSAHAIAVAALAGAGVVLALAIARVIPPVSVLGAALLLSFWEARARMASLRFVKEGPWWKHQYRAARPMDMLSYVGFKNLMIGALVFLTLKALGLLVL
ncbi:MAG: 4Fe-4S binding protein [Acidobacteria bacterium SCN 69-37]|nr:MAG: 4Fe-4S binding protein [Acidobacteria bacterium SCN 69-37]